MRDPLPESIDPQRYLGTSGGLSGIWPAAGCQRVLSVAERLLSDVSLEFRLVAGGPYVRLEGRIGVELELCCQRCLRTMSWRLDDQLKLVLVPENAIVAEQDGYEPLELNDQAHINTGKWIEDEIILRIPSVPVHDRIQDCDPEILNRAHEFTPGSGGGEKVADNPFTILKDWKENERG